MRSRRNPGGISQGGSFRMAGIATTCGELLAAGVGLLYGVVYLGIALSYSVTQKDFWVGASDDDRTHLETASRDLWSLADDTGTTVHNFIRLENDIQLHYLAPRQAAKRWSTLIVFVHGFPDSAHLFARQLGSPLAARAKLVALDLPGCGGSDSLTCYGPDPMLNTIVQAIIHLKQRYLSDTSKRCILVGHDWGGVVGFRVAAEMDGLVDHVVTLNSLYPAYAEEQLRAHVSRAKDFLSKWRMREAVTALSPVLSQLKKSSYTYMLTLPFPLARFMPQLALCLLKYAHSMEYKGSAKIPPEIAADRLAKSYGPGSLESALSAGNNSQYGPSVLARSKTHPPGDWDQRVRLYKDGLLRDDWNQDESLSSGNLSTLSGRVDDTQRSSSMSETSLDFKCPVTIIFGLRDVALDPRIVLDGIEKYFVEDQKAALERVIRLPDCGHWSILEEEGVKSLHSVLSELIDQR